MHLYFSIDKPVVITHMPSLFRLIEGETATLQCSVIAANPNTIIWRWFKTDSPSNVLNNGPIYRVHDIQRIMSGLYNCTASNSVGTAVAVTIAVDVLCESLHLKCLSMILYTIFHVLKL